MYFFEKNQSGKSVWVLHAEAYQVSRHITVNGSWKVKVDLLTLVIDENPINTIFNIRILSVYENKQNEAIKPNYTSLRI